MNWKLVQTIGDIHSFDVKIIYIEQEEAKALYPVVRSNIITE